MMLKPRVEPAGSGTTFPRGIAIDEKLVLGFSVRSRTFDIKLFYKRRRT
jgi:hypothetical protein